MIFRKTEIHRLIFALRIALPKQCMENVCFMLIKTKTP